MNFPKIIQSKNYRFYIWFEEAGENNYASARELQKLLQNFKDPKKSAQKIHQLEHHGDSIAHKVFEELRKSFITPLDREDITALMHTMDDIIDLIHASADTIEIYNIKKPTDTAIALADIIVQATKIIRDTLPKLRKRKMFPQILKAIIEINKLENEADQLYHAGIKSLFKNPKKPIDIIRWHNIYEILEDVTDKCEDIGDILRGFVTKYA